MIRDGNHFILLDGKWALIDGPWFDILNRARNSGASEIRIPTPPPLHYSFITSDASPYDITLEYITWKPQKWANTSRLLQLALRYKSPEIQELVYNARVRVAWVCENGILPATFNTIEEAQG